MAANRHTTADCTEQVVRFCVGQRLRSRPSSGRQQNGCTKRVETNYDVADGLVPNGHRHRNGEDEVDGRISNNDRNGVSSRIELNQRIPNGLHGEDLELSPKMTEAIRRLTAEFEKRYQEVFNESCDNIFMTPNNIQHVFMNAIITMFQDGIINWGRIVALLAFSGAVASRCVTSELPYLVNKVIDWTIDYINQNLTTWIDDNGGWEGFVAFFDGATVHSTQTSGSWPSISTLCGAAVSAIGALTIGALLTK